MAMATPRQRPATSIHSNPPTPSRARATPHLANSFAALSPASTRSVSAQSVPSYQPSVASSSFPHSHSHSHALSSPSVAPSNLGSIATTANPRAHRFTRRHARNRQSPYPPGQLGTANPDLVDLMALDEPDSVFRTFGVRDVRKIEQRASDAANAKVAELRTMVGERYRDLLAAADSIVRMRGAADKLLDRLESVEFAVSSAGDAIHDTTSQRRPSLVARPSDPSNPRTLSDPPTLSLTLHLFLNISSHVHSLLEQSEFLQAARLENLGRVVWREIEEYRPGPQADDADQGQVRSIKESFPIVVKHHESMALLGPLIVRRATVELRSSKLSPLSVAKVLAALILLDHASSSSALAIFLKARSQALASLLAPSRASTSKPSNTSVNLPAVQLKVEKALDCVLQTVEAVDSIFATDAPLLAQVLRELGHPSASTADVQGQRNVIQLSPILTTLPNYPTLARHLPSTILSYNPFLAPSSPSPSDTLTLLSAWLEASTKSLVSGFGEWITSLVASDDHPAVSLASLRDSMTRHLVVIGDDAEPHRAAAAAAARTHASHLWARLVELVEARLDEVYTLKLSRLVESLEPSLRSLLARLSSSSSSSSSSTASDTTSTWSKGSDSDSARFLFSIEPPPPSHGNGGGVGPNSHVVAGSFNSFLNKVGKRVDGRTPLIDAGLEELERGAREIRNDLASWLNKGELGRRADKVDRNGGGGDGGGEGEKLLRERYVEQVSIALNGLVNVLDKLLDEEESNGQNGISNSVFIGTFARQLSLSRTLTRDLLLGVAPRSNSSHASLLSTWQARLSDLQARSLRRWQADAVDRATSILRNEASAPSSSSLSSSSSSWRPLNQPSKVLLAALDSLLSSLHALPVHRVYSSPGVSPAKSLVEAFSTRALEVARESFELVRDQFDDGGAGEDEGKTRFAWDATLIGLIDENQRDSWREMAMRFIQLLPENDDDDDDGSSSAAALEPIARSATTFLLRTQSIYAPLFPTRSPLPLSTSSSADVASSAAAAAADPTTKLTNRSTPASSSSARKVHLLLPLGNPPPSAITPRQEFKTLVGFVQPGPRRIGLLPTKG